MLEKTGLTVIVAIVGATGSGKSELALQLAERIVATGAGSQIVNADSFSLYRGLDIGTAKTLDTRGVPHSQIDVLDIEQPASVAAYQRHARLDVEMISAVGDTPIVVGGSGLYVRALLDEIDFPGTDPQVRARLERELSEVGAFTLHQRLADADPLSAERIPVENTRRVVRALEVIEISGRPFSAQLPEYRYHWPDTVQVGLRIPPDELASRIELRTVKMWEAGWADEVSALLSRGFPNTPTASKATGYAEVAAYLRGEMSEGEAIAEISRLTIKLAKKQVKWFSRDRRIIWVNDYPTAFAELSKRGLFPL
ncbi:MAG: tRNA (adenosine(37)-N6)-dimethylallyltransferase MiaA [Varibaculum sp.]|nr:tRNA (adenosine(37)-N6)-dimethylallyltransferase MiaA [Varibaculum sp.]